MSTNQRNEERELDTWLSRTMQNHAEYIEDEGFTDGVLARLPNHTARPWRWGLWVLLLAFLAGALVTALVPVQPLVVTVASAFMAVSMMPVLQIGAALMVLVLLATGYWVWKEV